MDCDDEDLSEAQQDYYNKKNRQFSVSETSTLDEMSYCILLYGLGGVKKMKFLNFKMVPSFLGGLGVKNSVCKSSVINFEV